jgi:hypothetical protein
MQFWDKIISAVKNPLGYASLALLVLMTLVSLVIYQTQNFYLLLALIIIFCIYTIVVLWILSKRQSLVKSVVSDKVFEIKTYPNVQSIFQDMSKIINESVSSPRETKIEVMGLTLYHMWEYIKNYINKSSIERMNIWFSMVDSSSPIIMNLDNNWDEVSDGFYNSIQKHIKIHNDDLEDRKINIKIIRYNHLPIIHGVLINEEHLFLSYTSWTRMDQMQGATNFYSYYNLKTQVGKYHIGIFKNWINHINKNKCNQLCMKSLKDNNITMNDK